MKRRFFFYGFLLVRGKVVKRKIFFYDFLLVRQKFVDCIVEKICYGFLLVRQKFGVVYSLNL